MSNFLFVAIESILSSYPGGQPLSVFLKQYFKKNPKLGSRDRKAITEAVYIYFRYKEFARDSKSKLETIWIGMQLCRSENQFLKDTFLRADYQLSSEESLSLTSWKYDQNKIVFSNGISQEEWLSSILVQPDLFIRLRAAAKEKENIFKRLKKEGITFEEVDQLSGSVVLSFDNGVKIEKVLKPEEYVVQDWASQASISSAVEWMNKKEKRERVAVWDVCAGAGGKSIFWKDHRSDDFLLVTDIRVDILKNLKQRFAQYDLQHFKSMVLDVLDRDEMKKNLKQQNFDFIICDVPCTGSGTWARTPEQFSSFKPGIIDNFSKRQYDITFEAHKHLKGKGTLAYITCSVFQQENEEVVNKLLNTTNLKLQSQQLFQGISKKADSLFIALFEKS